jgi:hypothetical protein
VSVAILDVSADIFEDVSADIGAIVDVSVDIVDVESFVDSSEVEPPPHAASNADVQTTTNNFFMLI